MDYGVFDRGVNSIASSLKFAEKGKDKEFAACFREMIVAFYVGSRLVVVILFFLRINSLDVSLLRGILSDFCCSRNLCTPI